LPALPEVLAEELVGPVDEMNDHDSITERD
jgi:hypothetical protein